METGQDIQHALGRYWSSRLAVAFVTMSTALTGGSAALALANGSGHVGSFVLLGADVLLLGLLWGVPATVVTPTGFRRVLTFTPWRDVVAVFPAGPGGDPDVLIGLRNGKKVTLLGVKQNRRPGIIALAGRTPSDDN